jgi:hypothetical protein
MTSIVGDYFWMRTVSILSPQVLFVADILSTYNVSARSGLGYRKHIFLIYATVKPRY